MTITRRESLKLMAVASLAAAVPGCTAREVERAASRAANAATQMPLTDREPTVLNAHEYRTIHVLVDYIIPTDNRSGSATDAGVPAFIDFILEDTDDLETPLRGGLAWLDYQSTRRFGSTFLNASVADQVFLLDAIAYPDDAAPDMEPGVRFFSLLRDLTASGFWSSKIGVADLGYTGNAARAQWEGCPDPALSHLGVSYDA